MSDHYHPLNWLPHITLALNDLSGEKLAAIAGWLGQQDFNLDIAVNNLVLLQDVAGGQKLHYHFGW